MSGRRVDDALDLGGQCLEGVLLFGMVGMAGVYAADAAHRVSETPFGNVDIYASPG